MSENKTITVYIEKPVYEGKGLAFTEGKAVFVPLAVPGDTVKIIVTEEKNDFIAGEIIEVIDPSPERTIPRCPNFSICGGCCYLNIDYDTEIRYKKEILAESLSRIGGFKIEDIPDISVKTAERYHYRSLAEIKTQNGSTGFYMRRSNELVPFPEEGCLLLHKPLANFLGNMDKTHLDTGAFKIAADMHDSVITSLMDSPVITEESNGITYWRHIDQFFQVNRFLRSAMLEIVKDYSKVTKSDTFVDAACGCGFFALFLSQYAAHGTGFDSDRAAITWAKKNAKKNHARNITFFAGTIEELHPYKYRAPLLIIDPPRAGISKRGRKTIASMNPERIVYISCNPATFSRDLKDLVKSGYSLNKVTLIDMFPCTHHVETISLLTRP